MTLLQMSISGAVMILITAALSGSSVKKHSSLKEIGCVELYATVFLLSYSLRSAKAVATAALNLK